MSGNEVEKIFPSPSRAVSRWLNVVLDLNGILCVCEEYKYLPKIHSWNFESNPHSSSIPVKIGPKAVYVRPSCSKFLSALSDFADIIVWNSMREPTTRQICEYLFRGLAMPLHILGQDSCDRINVMGRNNRVTTMKVKGTHKDIFLKMLSKHLFGRFGGKFTKENTLVIDDSPVKHILNDSENVLLPVSWLHDGAGQSDTFLIDTLLPCLQELHRSHDIRLGARVHQGISQPMLSEDPSRREEYVEVKAAIENAEMFSQKFSFL